MTVLDHDVVADQLKNAPTENKSVLSFVSRIAALTTPDDIVWIDGSEAQKNEIAEKLVEAAPSSVSTAPRTPTTRPPTPRTSPASRAGPTSAPKTRRMPVHSTTGSLPRR